MAVPVKEGTKDHVRRNASGTVPLNRASIADTLRVGAVVMAPAIARGVIARRPRIVALAEEMQADLRAGRLLKRLRHRYGKGPLHLRIPGRSFALLLTPEDTRRALTQSPEPFSLDTWEKHASLAHFQPHGVLISRGADRADRRAFNEDVLDTAHPLHCLADAFSRKIEEEAAVLLRSVADSGELDWGRFRVAWWRVIRRIVLGDAARDDHRVSDLLTKLRMNADWAFAHPRRRVLRARFQRRLDAHLRRAEPDSLAGLVATAPKTARTEPAQQVPQWLFAYEPAGMAAFRTLALLAAHPEQMRRARREAEGETAELPFLRACVQESLRLWPTTMAILRESTEDTVWAGRTMPAGTGMLIFTPFLQRDDELLPFADSFVPDIWLDGRAREDWSIVPFSAGPGECPGRQLVLLTASRFLAALLREHDFRQRAGVRLRADRPLPRTFGPFRLRFSVI
ncbi:cytochrome P450 [Actinocorallia populi]|uniref:cytochrome P450 n=1 Tax=Actinocorallia populi TaxID=2079200 RepID=UPI000D08AE74|nr:cytochrome P450 [Actinocorallia populi]